jgi:hypothetical protein
VSEANIQGLLHPAQANLGFFFALFQSLQLPSTQSKSPLAPKSRTAFEVLTVNRTFIFHISIRINCNRISEGLLSLRPISKCDPTEPILMEDDITVIPPKFPTRNFPGVSNNSMVEVHTFQADTTCLYDQEFMRGNIVSILKKCEHFGFDPPENVW